MKNKIFISHSSKDISIVELFVEKILRLGLNIPSERIFCTSIEGHGVKSGEYIPDRLREEIQNSSLALLFLSNNYKESEVCLNEVGAAWAVLQKEHIIPLLLPNVGYDKLGFLDLNRLGLKIFETKSIIQLVQDCKEQLNPHFDLNQLHKQIQIFIDELKISHPVAKKESKEEPKKEVSEWERCFDSHLHAFDNILRKSITSKNDGIHNITDKKKQNQILSNLSKANFLDSLWYKHSGGDYYVKHLTQLANGNWLISGFNWEVKVSDMWVSMNVENQYDFILIHSEAQEPFKIESDIGGQEFYAGVLENGTLVSENERLNSYAEINGETIDLMEAGVQPRYRDSKARWVFLVSDYHKAGFNPDETIDFCKKLDLGEIQVSEENIMNFLYQLRNHPTVIKYR